MPDEFAVVIIADKDDKRPDRLKDALNRRTTSLQSIGESLKFVDAAHVVRLAPDTKTVCVVFCGGILGRKEPQDPVKKIERNEQIVGLTECLRRQVRIFPVVEELKRWDELAPEEVGPFNGFELRADVDELAGLVLECLGLQRGRRKIFISYARIDSAEIARQLREALTSRWYTAFHDVVSIRPGSTFQTELMQELADSDVMLLLNGPNVAARPYVQDEIAFANRAWIGGVQVVWPHVDPGERGTLAFTKVDLEWNGDGTLLSDACLDEVLRAVAFERTAIQKRREDELQGRIAAYARKNKWQAVCHPGRHVTLNGPGRSIRLNVALGVPTSMELERAWHSGAQRDPKWIVYDRLGLTDTMADHLAFLGRRLPLEILNVRAARRWRVIQ